MPEPWLLIAGIVVGGSFLLLASALLLSARLSEEHALDPAELHSDRLLATLPAEQGGTLQRDLARAGFVHPSAPTIFGVLKFVTGGASAIAGFMFLSMIPALSDIPIMTRLGFIGFTFSLGYLLPMRALSKRVAAYRVRIERAVPDALDLMQICVDAGQSLDLALLRVARELGAVHPELAAHFAWASEAVAAGLDREAAFMKIADETGNDDLRLLAMTLVQATKLGTPISRTLRVFGNDLRDHRLRKVEEKANVLPTKMTLGTMLFTVPPLLILLLTPAIVRLSDML
ncbi:type II secretion system F family protein [Thioclava electrotropha]|uniref:Type II secretion system F family protein n=1 Tax=Thioclava electrotropha TaxID=1549850 RepID=A0ABX6YZQ3_9RHOB|nr:type II secretion system F family protein [Thioclava electrotropha]QPZ93366.1 type II secretion system F family protein [Thioclava electrotropha]